MTLTFCARVRMHVTCTSAGVRIFHLRWPPRRVSKEIFAAFAVQAFGVVFADAATVDLIKQNTAGS